MLELDTELFRRATRGNARLPHPTARAFESAAWAQALKDIQTPTRRDLDLALSALWIGVQTQTLRLKLDEPSMRGLGRRGAVALAMAQANREYLVLSHVGKRHAREAVRKGEAQLDMLAQRTVGTGRGGADMAPADLTDAQVDSLPYWLHWAGSLPDTQDAPKLDYAALGARSAMIFSIEHGLRDLWQQALWEGWRLAGHAPSLTWEPADEPLARRWPVWLYRQQALDFQAAAFDLITLAAVDGVHHPRERVLEATVVRLDDRAGRPRRFMLGRPGPRSPGNVRTGQERTVLEDSYVTPFLNAALPYFAGTATSCALLQQAWAVLRDAASLLVQRLPRPRLADAEGVRRFALVVRRAELVRIIGECCKLPEGEAAAVVDFFTAKTEDTSALFGKGLWSQPLVSLGGKNVAIALAPLFLGSPVRRVELWLERGGLSDGLASAARKRGGASGVGRGGRYEAWARDEVARALAQNPILHDAASAREAVERSGGEGEQIDLLMRVGRTLLVGEVKCLLAPAESIERFRYLGKLKDAAAQAVRKAEWVRENPGRVSAALGIGAVSPTFTRVLPLVVVNQGFGVGLDLNGCPIVDLRFLCLFLSDGSYVSAGALGLRGKESIFAQDLLYRSAEEAEARLPAIFIDVPPLRRFSRNFAWRSFEFPTASGEPLHIMAGSLAQAPGER